MIVTVYRNDPPGRLAEKMDLFEAIELCKKDAEELKSIEELFNEHTRARKGKRIGTTTRDTPSGNSESD